MRQPALAQCGGLGALDGTVSDDLTGDPIAGAAVTVERLQGGQWTLATDAAGAAGDGPTLDGMMGYQMVIWFSGDKWGSSAGPNAQDEANLAAYLDAGGRLFLLSQDYLYDWGLTPFGQTYLGIGSYTNDSGGATAKHGVAGDPIGDGLGPYPLTYPAGFSDWGLFGGASSSRGQVTGVMRHGTNVPLIFTRPGIKSEAWCPVWVGLIEIREGGDRRRSMRILV